MSWKVEIQNFLLLCCCFQRTFTPGLLVIILQKGTKLTDMSDDRIAVSGTHDFSVNKNPTHATVCRYLFTAKLHVSGVTAPIIRSIKNCTRSLRYRSYYLYRYSPPTWSDRDWFVRVACDSHKPVPIRPRWRGVAVQVV